MKPTHEQVFAILQRELDDRLLVRRVLRGRVRADGRMTDLFLVAAHENGGYWFHGYYPATAPEKDSYLRLREASAMLEIGHIDLPTAVALGKGLTVPPRTVAALMIGAPDGGDRYAGLARHPGMPEAGAIMLIRGCLPQCGASLGLVD